MVQRMTHYWIPYVLALAGTLSAQPKKPTNPLGNSPKVAEAGRVLYNRTCTGCHGPDGREGDRAPSLDANRRYFRVSEAAIFDVIKNGIPGTVMPSSGLADDDAWKIVAFIRNVRATASDLVVPGNVENGMAVFTGAGGCSGCHMIRGQGGVLGPDLSSIGAQLSLNKLQEALTKERPIPHGYRPATVTTLRRPDCLRRGAQQRCLLPAVARPEWKPAPFRHQRTPFYRLRAAFPDASQFRQASRRRSIPRPGCHARGSGAHQSSGSAPGRKRGG